MWFYISISSSSSSSPAALSRCRLSSSDASVSSSVSTGSRVRFTPRCLATARAYWMLKRFQSQLGTEGIRSAPVSRFAATSRIRCSCPQNVSPPQFRSCSPRCSAASGPLSLLALPLQPLTELGAESPHSQDTGQVSDLISQSREWGRTQ